MSPEFRDYLLDLLAPVGPVAAKRMFGGGGLFLDGTMFAIVADDVLFLKADDQNRSEFEDAGMSAFTYEKKGEPIALSYFEAPAEALDDSDELCAWSRRAWEAARRAAEAKPKRRKKKRRPS